MDVKAAARSRTKTSGRIHSLDGLRGVAALIVVVHHTLLLVPALVAPYRDPHATSVGDLAWWLTYTPLHLLWDGSVAVVVFFVLSGFVLTMPLMQPRAFNWLAYYPKRIIRLYVPVWGAVALSLLWPAIFPHRETGAVSDWLSGHVAPGLNGVLRDAVLIVGSPGATNSVLWSLKWEVIFSLLLPLFVIFAARWRKLLPLKVACLVVALLIGAIAGPAEKPYQMTFLFHLPVFAVGCLLASEWDRIIDAASRVESRMRKPVLRPWLMVLAVLMLVSYWLVYSTGSTSEWLGPVAAATRVIQVIGAAILLFLAATWNPLASTLQRRPLMWLGQRSFSLYLVHEPIVVASGFLVAAALPGAWALLVVVPVALLVAELFYRGVERPSHRLANSVGKVLDRRTPRHLVSQTPGSPTRD